MKTYICTVCGFDYSEAAGDPDRGIAPGTRWEDVPEDWVCPICGADKSMFYLQAEAEEKPAQAEQPAAKSAADASRKQLAVMASNLARGAGKQYREAMSAAFGSLANYFEGQSEPEGDLQSMQTALGEDISTSYATAFEAARRHKDRGALRALTWGEKVSKIQAAVIKRFQKEGDAALEGSNVYVCDACGFIFIGDEAPEICPVCKVPRFKFNQIKRGATA